MFFFTKNKQNLTDIIPSNYIDIHSHLLPAIDDGSKSIEETIELVTALTQIGFSEFTTTPHVMDSVWENSKSTIQNNATICADELTKASITTNFKAAAEYMLDDRFRKLLHEEPLLTLKENYVLVEMSYLNPHIQLYDILFDIQIAGYKPILAHPERYSFYHFSLDEYKKLKKAGCLFQLNLLSTVGYYGPEVCRISDYLLKNNLIDFVGSDVHHMKHVDFLNKKIVLKNIEPIRDAFQNNMLFKH